MSAVRLAAARSGTPMQMAGGRACAEPLLLQMGARRSKHVSSPTLISPRCPGVGQHCTIIVLLKDGANGTKVAEPYKDKATFLNAVGEVLLDFGTGQASECCAAYKGLLDTAGVKSVEFDQLVYAADDVKSTVNNSDSAKVAQPIDTWTCNVCLHVYDAAKEGGGAAFEDVPNTWNCPVCGSPKSAFTKSVHTQVVQNQDVDPSIPNEQAVRYRHGSINCPVDGEQCTVIVVLEDGADGSKVVEAHKNKEASVSYLRTLGIVSLNFGISKASECCNAHKRLVGRTGVKSVEFDHQVHAIQGPSGQGLKSRARVMCLWPVLPWIMTWVLNAFQSF